MSIERYHRMREENRKPDAWTVFIEIMAIALMVVVAIYIWRITP